MSERVLIQELAALRLNDEPAIGHYASKMKDRRIVSAGARYAPHGVESQRS
jgi:hypothetical protein